MLSMGSEVEAPQALISNGGFKMAAVVVITQLIYLSLMMKYMHVVYQILLS